MCEINEPDVIGNTPLIQHFSVERNKLWVQLFRGRWDVQKVAKNHLDDLSDQIICHVQNLVLKFLLGPPKREDPMANLF